MLWDFVTYKRYIYIYICVLYIYISYIYIYSAIIAQRKKRE